MSSNNLIRLIYQVKELRFLPPVPNDPWDDVRDATTHGNICKQFLTGDEDCLFLSVYTPLLDFDENTASNALPVMVFIHGGAFSVGDNSMADGFFFADHDVIVVSLNYRLGPFGFLSLNTTEVSGNQGIRDQQLALKWVQKNIHKFGGDPTKVTIFGQSAGSWSVIHHLFAPGSKGLFSGAIAQSGTILGINLRAKSNQEAYDAGHSLANELLCLGSNPLDCMQSRPASAIAALPYFPRTTIDGVISNDPILPTQPEQLLEVSFKDTF